MTEPSLLNLHAFKEFSARIGADPLLVQGAGGNTSFKHDGVMIIKASGCFLADALKKNIFVTVDLSVTRSAIAAHADAAVTSVDQNKVLRPSIETTMHALLPQKIVVHVHSIHTIAYAVRQDADALFQKKLAGLSWAFVPYQKPGLLLTKDIQQSIRPETNVIVLGNHGLVIAGDTIDAVSALLADVENRLQQPARVPPSCNHNVLQMMARGTDYELPDDRFLATHGLGTDPAACAYARRGSLYPDHVVFLGPAVTVLPKSIDFSTWLKSVHRAPPVVVIEDAGVLCHTTCQEGARVMALCLWDVLARIPVHERLRYLSDAEEQALLVWDAEQYRQTIKR